MSKRIELILLLATLTLVCAKWWSIRHPKQPSAFGDLQLKRDCSAAWRNDVHAR